MVVLNKLGKQKILVGLYVLCGVLMIWIVLFSSHQIRGLDGDHVPQTYALFVQVAKALYDGGSSFWNPYLWGGFPNAGNFITEAYYPINWILCGLFYNPSTNLVSYAIIPWNLMVHFAIYYVGMFFLIKKIGFSNLNAFVVGVSSVCCFSVFSFRTWVVYVTGFCWIPVMILLAVSMFEASKCQKGRYAACLGIVFAMEALLSVSVMLVFSVLIFASLFVLYQVKHTKKDRIDNFKYSSLAGILGILLSFPALISAVVFMQNMRRYVPDIGFVEAGTQIPYEEFIRHKYTFEEFKQMVSFTGGETGLSISAIVLVLGLAGMFCRNKKTVRVYIMASVLAAISFFYSFALLFPRVAYYIPGVNNMREPFMYSILFGLGWSILASYGFHALECKVMGHKAFGKVFYFQWVLAAAILLLLAYNLIIKNAYCAFLSFVFLSTIIFLCYEKSKYNRAVFCLISVLLVFTEYWNFYHSIDSYAYEFSDAVKRVEEVSFRTGEMVSYLQTLEPQDNYYRMSSYFGNCYPVNMASILGFYDIQGYVNPITSYSVALHLEVDFEKRCQLQNVKYILANKNTDPATIAWFKETYPSMEWIGEWSDNIVSFDDMQPNDVSIYRMNCCLGDAWLVQNLEWYPQESKKEEIISRLNEADFSVQHTALAKMKKLSASEQDLLKNMPSINNAWNIECMEQNSNVLKYQVLSEGSAVFVAAEPFYPGWNVYVNGERKSLLEIDGTNRGVIVPPGDSVVEFVYRPVGFYIGSGLQVFGCILLIVLIAKSKKAEEEFS